MNCHLFPEAGAQEYEGGWLRSGYSPETTGLMNRTHSVPNTFWLNQANSNWRFFSLAYTLASEIWTTWKHLYAVCVQSRRSFYKLEIMSYESFTLSQIWWPHFNFVIVPIILAIWEEALEEESEDLPSYLILSHLWPLSPL